MLSPKTLRNISRIIPFGIIWLIFSMIYSLLEKGILADLKNYPATGIPYNFTGSIFITAVFASIYGLAIGAIEIFYLNKLFMQKSFFQKIFYKTLIYLSLIISFLLIITVVHNSHQLNTSVFSEQVWDNVRKFFYNFSFWGVEIYIAAIIGVSLFYSEVSENLGQGVLNNFFTGKYHTPVEEERIFMFLDMKSSTTIAERLGHVRYFEMLREYYSDLSDPVIMYSGKIYQYAGDEIIVSWEMNNGLKDNNCIKCFFAMKEEFKKQSEKYHKEFGLLPEFKAGFHYGKVTTGEIGVLKKDIFFTGDVLNTTARIQGLCNTYNVDILVSGQLIKNLPLDSEIQTEALGETELRGRDEKIKLFTIIKKIPKT